MGRLHNGTLFRTLYICNLCVNVIDRESGCVCAKTFMMKQICNIITKRNLNISRSGPIQCGCYLFEAI